MVGHHGLAGRGDYRHAHEGAHGYDGEGRSLEGWAGLVRESRTAATTIAMTITASAVKR
jgi:hypothetical protein